MSPSYDVHLNDGRSSPSFHAMVHPISLISCSAMLMAITAKILPKLDTSKSCVAFEFFIFGNFPFRPIVSETIEILDVEWFFFFDFL